ncbi:MAG: branched-chain amino acid ABC transporter permease [Longibaculum sp.]
MDFLTQIINGLSAGGMYALVAIGYTMVYGIAKMINFAHGEIIMVGAYLTYVVFSILGMPVIVAIIASILGCAMLGVVTEKVAYKPLRNSSSLSVLITAIGVSYLLQNLFLIIFGSAAITFPDFLPSGQLSFGGLSISYVSLLSLVLTGTCTVLLLFFINKTKLGKAMRAVSEDKGAAELMGINVNQTISMTFAIGSGLGAIAGIIYGLSYSLINPYLGAMLGIKAFIAAVLGGIGSVPGAMVGGLIIGVAEAFTVSYISSTFSDAVVFGILIFILLVKPAGLFGHNVREKV